MEGRVDPGACRVPGSRLLVVRRPERQSLFRGQRGQEPAGRVRMWLETDFRVLQLEFRGVGPQQLGEVGLLDPVAQLDCVCLQADGPGSAVQFQEKPTGITKYLAGLISAPEGRGLRLAVAAHGQSDVCFCGCGAVGDLRGGLGVRVDGVRVHDLRQSLDLAHGCKSRVESAANWKKSGMDYQRPIHKSV